MIERETVVRNSGGRPSSHSVRRAAMVVGASSIGAQTTAEAQLARWKRRLSTPSVPAISGTTTRAGPTKRPTKTAIAPQRSKNPWPFARSSGLRASQGSASIWRA